MSQQFQLDGHWLEIRKSTMSGGVKLFVDGQPIELQKSMSVGSQFQFSSEKRYDLELLGHQLVIIRNKPLLFGYYRPWTFNVYVDGQPFVSVQD